MPVITVFSATHCGGEEVAERVAQETGYGLLTTDSILSDASQSSGIPVERLVKVLTGPRSVFERYTHEMERGMAWIRLAMARAVQLEDRVFHGLPGQLLPSNLTHVLRVGLHAPLPYRVKRAVQGAGVSARSAESQLTKDDELLRTWTTSMFGQAPWDTSLYDLFLPMDTTPPEEVVKWIVELAGSPKLHTDATVRRAMCDFLVSAQVHLALAEGGKGEGVDVTVDGGVVTITINRYVIWLERFERELKRIASDVKGAERVETRIGPHFQRPNIYPGLDSDVPRKILLVDDEVEFVQTLSERLQTRNLGSAVAYDGEEALAIAENDAPDVMVLDMKMPGMDGMQVLREIKSKHPRTEVIVLTAHGSGIEKQRALDLGAFAYLRKPADIDDLARLMKEAYQRVREGQQEDTAPEEGDAHERSED